MSISRIIRDARKAKGLRQAELAALCHVTRTTIVNVELENADPSLNLLQFIALALDIKLCLVSAKEVVITIAERDKLRNDNLTLRTWIAMRTGMSNDDIDLVLEAD